MAPPKVTWPSVYSDAELLVELEALTHGMPQDAGGLQP